MPEVIYRRSRGRAYGRDFGLLCVAFKASMGYLEPYLRTAAFGGSPVSVREGAVPSGSGSVSDLLSAVPVDPEDDLIAVVYPADPRGGVGDPGVPALVQPGDVVLPLRVHLVAHLAPPTASGPGAADPTARAGAISAGAISAQERKRQRRRVRAWGYTSAISHDPADFEFFYERMHLPTMDVRHGAHARSTGKAAAFDSLFRQGFLFQVLADDGRPVAAVLCHVDTDVCNARLVGWLDGDPIHLEREALKTANHFLLNWARDAGFSRVDFQGCEPFLRKGTFQSKRHLGTTAEIPRGELGESRILLRCGRDSAALRDLLAAHPVIAVDATRALEPVYFTDHARPPRLDIPHSCHGLRGARMVDLDVFASAGSARDGARSTVFSAPPHEGLTP